MAYDYDKLYGAERDALGPPTDVLVAFFDRHIGSTGRVLDVGCGQGRDALFIARKGHAVVGVDLSPNGIRDLVAAARAEGLAIAGVVADITGFVPEGDFDIILIDRTLHMLERAARLAVLARLLDHVAAGGWVLIADEPANMAGFRRVIAAHARAWTTRFEQRGYLFVQRD